MFVVATIRWNWISLVINELSLRMLKYYSCESMALLDRFAQRVRGVGQPCF